MILTIDLPLEQATALKAKALAQGVSAERYVVGVLEMYLVDDLLPAITNMSAEEKANEFVQWAKSHRHTPPLSDEAISRSATYSDRW